jgi:hypothetical protein
MGRGLAVMLVVAGLAAGLGASVAHAQPASNVLQRDLRPANRFQSSQANSSRGSLSEQLRQRNALVTGNIGGGKSLQIDRPYLDSGDLRARLGTDDLFAFRRDSFSASALGLRGTDSIQYQNTFSTGGLGLVPRSNYASSARALAPDGAPTRVTDPARTSTTSPGRLGTSLVDDTASRLGTLRMTSSYASTLGLAPTAIGYRRTPDGLDRVTASSLLGVRNQSTGLGGPRSRFAEDRSGQLIADATVAKVERTPTAYDALRDRLNRASGAGRVDLSARTKPETPGDSLIPDPSARTATTTTSTTPTGATGSEGTAAWEAPMGRLRERLSMLTATGAASGARARAFTEAAMPLEPEAVRSILDAGGLENTLLVGEVRPGDYFGEYIEAGQTAMAEGRYFDAEERFVRALGIRSDDVTAQIGRAHAQLGAGLFVSSAMNLRVLFEKHPELLGVRFAGVSIPPKPRLRAMAGELRLVIKRLTDLSMAPPEDASLLLMYTGRLLADYDMMREGLAHLRAARGSASNDAVPELLESLWITPFVDENGKPKAGAMNEDQAPAAAAPGSEPKP